MRLFLVSVSIIAGLNLVVLADRYVVDEPLESAVDSQLQSIIGGAATCKVTVYDGVCSPQTPAPCNSGVPDPCVSEDPMDEESQQVCVSAGTFQLLESSKKLYYPNCRAKAEDGSEFCKSVDWYCYQEVKCDNDCYEWFPIPEDPTITYWLCSNSSLIRNAGMVQTDEADASRPTCTYTPPQY